MVLEAWSHFYFAFHWVSFAMVVLHIVMPRPRKHLPPGSPASHEPFTPHAQASVLCHVAPSLNGSGRCMRQGDMVTGMPDAKN
jgi:cytochrome b561